jgi:hypothetical protein
LTFLHLLTLFRPEPFVFSSALRNLEIRIYKNIIFPVVLCGCESWSVTLREEHRLMIFKNKVLSRIFGPNRDELIGGLGKLHNEKLHKLYFSPNIIRMIK